MRGAYPVGARRRFDARTTALDDEQVQLLAAVPRPYLDGAVDGERVRAENFAVHFDDDRVALAAQKPHGKSDEDENGDQRADLDLESLLRIDLKLNNRKDM